MSLIICMKIKDIFHINRFTLSLTLKQRLKATRMAYFVLYLIIVPSFWVKYKGHFKPSWFKAPQNAFTVRWQSGFRLSLSTAAFSRSRSPMRPTSWERVILMSGQTDLMIAPTWSSCFPETGEKTPTMTTFLIPRSNSNHWHWKLQIIPCLAT